MHGGKAGERRESLAEVLQGHPRDLGDGAVARGERILDNPDVILELPKGPDVRRDPREASRESCRGGTEDLVLAGRLVDEQLDSALEGPGAQRVFGFGYDGRGRGDISDDLTLLRSLDLCDKNGGGRLDQEGSRGKLGKAHNLGRELGLHDSERT